MVVRNSELLAGTVDKSTLGSSSKNNLYYLMQRDYSAQESIDAMWRLARMAPYYLTNIRGFSMGAEDVQPSAKLIQKKMELVFQGYHSSLQFTTLF